MKITFLFLSLLLLFGLAIQIKARDPKLNRDDRTLVRAMDVSQAASSMIREDMESSKSIPRYLFDNAEAIAVFPGDPEIKPLLGGNDVGIVSIRDPQTGLWEPPIFLRVDNGPMEDNLKKGRDIILFAMDRKLAEAFLTDRELDVGFTRGGSFGQVAEPGTRPADINQGFIAFMRDRKNMKDFFSFAGNPIHSGSKIVHAKDLNASVYGKRDITRFRPVSKLVPSRVLTFTETLNRYARRPIA